MDTLPINFRALLGTLGLTHCRAAEVCGVTEQTIRNYCVGRKAIDPMIVVILVAWHYLPESGRETVQADRAKRASGDRLNDHQFTLLRVWDELPPENRANTMEAIAGGVGSLSDRDAST